MRTELWNMSRTSSSDQLLARTLSIKHVRLASALAVVHIMPGVKAHAPRCRAIAVADQIARRGGGGEHGRSSLQESWAPNIP
jgi:hypothetical protein